MTKTSVVGASLFTANQGIWEKIGHVLSVPCHVVAIPGPMRFGALRAVQQKITGIFFPIAFFILSKREKSGHLHRPRHAKSARKRLFGEGKEI